MKETSDLPTMLKLELTSHCNLTCSYCFRSHFDIHDGQMNDQVLNSVLQQLNELIIKLRSSRIIPDIKLHWRGEPLLYPTPWEVTEALKALGCRVVLVTNGLLFNLPMARLLGQAGLDELVFSVDAATARTYKKLRGGDLNVLLLQWEKSLAEFRSINPSAVVKANFVAMEANESEINTFREYWSVRGVIPILMRYNNLDGRDRFNRPAKIHIEKDCNTCNFHCDDPEDDMNRTVPCASVRQKLVVGWDGLVFPCPMCCENQHSLGNIIERSLFEIWADHSERVHKEIERSGKFRLPECASCVFWC